MRQSTVIRPLLLERVAGLRVAVLGPWRELRPELITERLIQAGAICCDLDAGPELLVYGDAAPFDSREHLQLNDRIRAAERAGVHVHCERELLAALGLLESPPASAGPLENYVERFTELTARLAEDPRIRRVNAYTGVPVSAARMGEIEARWGSRLSPDLRALYRQADGLSLQWSWFDPDDPGGEPKAGRLSMRDAYDDHSGSMCIVPLEALLFTPWIDDRHLCLEDRLSPSWMDFAGERIREEDFYRALRLFDACHSFYMAMLVMPEGARGGPVILSDDHQAAFTDSGRACVETYLEGQLQTLAHVETRAEALRGRQGEPQITRWPTELSEEPP